MLAKLAFLHQTSLFRSHWKRRKELKPAWSWETKLEVCLPGICSGWGNEHYVTFDGTYYHFKENCTYVLVELIQPSSEKFWIHIDNYYCGAADGAICSMSLLIFHSNSLVILTQAKEHGKGTNLVKYFVKMSSHYFAVVTLLPNALPCQRMKLEKNRTVGNAVTLLPWSFFFLCVSKTLYIPKAWNHHTIYCVFLPDISIQVYITTY